MAAENFYGSIASQVGAGHVHVTSIITSPTADPHEYTSTVADTEAVAGAKLVIVNGAGYDSFMDKLLGASSASGRIVIHVDAVTGARGSDVNPHLWYDPRTATLLAGTLASKLAQIDPRDAADYRGAAARFVASLAPVESEIASLHRRFAGLPFAYTERVPAYLTELIGLVVKTPSDFAKANEEGTDPPPQSVATMRALVAGHQIRVLLYNSQAASQATASIRDLARADGVPAVGVSETAPRGETYQQWQLGQLRSIDAALSRP